MFDLIEIEGARTHNLKDISVNISQGKITCLAGPSGSGKSSLAISTLYLESKRRFINSLSTSQKFFWDLPQACDVDRIGPVLPTWLLPQSNPVVSSRTTVGDLLGVTTDLAKIFFKFQNLHCQVHDCDFVRSSYEFLLKKLFETHHLQGPLHFLVAKETLDCSGMSFTRSLDQDGLSMRTFCEEDHFVEIFRTKKLDPCQIAKRLKELKLTQYWIFSAKEKFLGPLLIDSTWVCLKEGESIPILNSFHHFNPLQSAAACKQCRGMGDLLKYDRRKVIPNKMVSLNEGACTLLQFKRFKRYQKQFLDFCEQQGISTELPFYQIETDQVWEKIEKGGKDFKGLRSIYEILEKKRYKKPYRIFARKFKSEFVCESCLGTRLEKDLFNYYLPSDGGRLSYLDILKRPLSELLNSLKVCTIKDRLLEELITKLSITIELGLSHLCLTDNAKQLSTSEYQRLLLVKFFSYQGSGSLFILDEPSVGLSSKEQRVLLKFLKKLKEKGNTVLIIEHSTFLQKNADEIIWMGPKAGRLGGEVVYQGNWKKQFSILPKALKAKPSKSKGSLEIYKAKFRNFTIDTFKLPLRTLTYIKGDSSSGASEFFNIVVSNEISQKLSGDLINFERYSVEQFKLKGELKKIIVFSYEARSFSARSTIGTLLGITPMIRKYYSSLHESKVMNLKDGHFSPNSDMGKCRSCEGRGIQAIEMDILEDVTFTCPDCGGKKIVPLYADISDGEQSFYEAISQAMDNILSRIKLTPKFIRIFDYIKKLRLEYLSLDRSFNSLSGGEKQRILLLLEVLKGEDKAFYLFENLSTGLSIEDLYYVAIFLQDIVDQGNTVVIMDQHTLWDGVAQTKIDFSN